MLYYIKYHTGAGDETAASIDEAKRIADDGAAYTQQSITIEDEDGNEITRRPWWGVEYDPDETEDTVDEIISFGKFGYYGAWIE